MIMYNPSTRRGRAAEVARRTTVHLRGAGSSVVQVWKTEYPRHAVSLTREMGDQIDRLIVIGGDGTLREAIEGLGDRSQQVVIGLIPMGNANVMAREIGIPLEPDRAIELLTVGRATSLDIGVVNGAIFLCMVGVGFDADVVAAVGAIRKSRLGAWWYRTGADFIYGLAGLYCLVSPFPDQFDLVADGCPMAGKFCAAVVSNTSVYAKGWKMVPDANPADGLLHFVARRKAGFRYAVWSIHAAARARKVPGHVADYRAAREIRIDCEKPLNVQVDGDPAGKARVLEVKLASRRFQIITPRSRRDSDRSWHPEW